jgi:methionyl-tRNA formyltransferase
MNQRLKSDTGKVVMAARLRGETTLTIGQIAQRLHTGGRKILSSKLHRWRKTNARHT